MRIRALMSAHIHWATSPAPPATTSELRLSMRPRLKSIIQRTFAQWQPSFLERDRRTIYSKVKALEAGKRTGQVRSTAHQRNRPGCPLPSTSSSMATSVRSDTSMAIVFPNFPDVQNQIHTQKGECDNERKQHIPQVFLGDKPLRKSKQTKQNRGILDRNQCQWTKSVLTWQDILWVNKKKYPHSDARALQELTATQSTFYDSAGTPRGSTCNQLALKASNQAEKG